jgi:hypothetical protein
MLLLVKFPKKAELKIEYEETIINVAKNRDIVDIIEVLK